MSFVANPAAPATPPVPDAIVGDGWYPTLSIAAFRSSIRLGTTVSDQRARDALLGGLMSAAVALSAWRVAEETAGARSLDTARDPGGLPSASIGGEKRTVILWRRAVYAYAAADLAETHSDISATEGGRDRREVRAASADEHRRNATIAVRDIMGRTRAKIALV